ncbi:MAG: phosphatase PAP2 family protein [Chitinophagaceae bacterium]|nr:phosphatase PAP2 family protein [Chitinophagaceae bacterium]
MKFFKNYRAYEGGILYFLLFAFGILFIGLVCLSVPKGVSFIWINHGSYRSETMDILIKGFTDLGTVYGAILVALIFILKRSWHSVLIVVVTFLLSGEVARILKHYFNHPRPASFFRDIHVIRAPSWNQLDYLYSFPSGHTTTIFSLAVIVSLFFIKKKWVAVVSFLIACTVGYSRIYLGEHFLEDVWAGALTGTTVGVICFIFINWLFKKWKNRKTPQIESSPKK